MQQRYAAVYQDLGAEMKAEGLQNLWQILHSKEWKTLKRKYPVVKRNPCTSGDSRVTARAVVVMELNLPKF